MDSDEENKCPKLANSMSNLTSSVESEERISNELNTRRQTTVINRFLMLKKGEVSDSRFVELILTVFCIILCYYVAYDTQSNYG